MTNTDLDDTPLSIAFEIAVRLDSPVCLSTGVPTGNLTTTFNYIPGSTVRGMLAQFYLEQVGAADETFGQLFLSGDVTYGNLYFSTSMGAVPTPLSARSCKHEPGFRADEDKHGVIDVLIRTFAWKWAEEHGKTPLPPLDLCPTPSCQAPLEHFTRFYEPPTGAKRTVPTESLRRIITRSATDDCLQTAEKGLLYSLEVLDPTAIPGYVPASGLVFCATKEAAALVLQHVLKPAFEDAETSFFIGTARSRGLGEVVTAGRPLSPSDPVKHPVSLADRLQEFNDAIIAAGVNDGRTYFSITLHADTIMQDEFFRFYSTIPASLLAWEAGLDAKKFSLETYFTDAHLVAGWNAALRTPKTEMVAIRMGATFLYAAADIEKHLLLEKLTHVEAHGLGARRTEGFGRVKVCDPFHMEAGEETI